MPSRPATARIETLDVIKEPYSHVVSAFQSIGAFFRPLASHLADLTRPRVGSAGAPVDGPFTCTRQARLDVARAAGS
ncbi:MAG: hypothetical protein P4L82_09340 [Ancalomicrobiaceae bacterium]|nr:hypothetical protein [Ancalomicrobiaceae bacterium]